MKAKVLADGELFVQYGFVYVDSGVGGWDEEVDQRAGQRNGLAGAAQAGFVMLTTGTHTGDVPLRFELYRKEPPVDERWDEIVEVSVDLRDRRLEVTSFDRELAVRKLRQNGPHRLRYSAIRFEDERHRREHEVALDRYLVQLWPAPMGPDEIVKKTSGVADYWHGLARKTEPNPSLLEQAAVDRAADEAEVDRRDADERAWQRELTLGPWGGREPSPRLRALDPDATGLAQRHRDVVDAVEALPADRQRSLALEVTRRVCALDARGPVDWSPALAALEAGRPLPPPFDDEETLRDLLLGVGDGVEVVVTIEGGSFRGPAPRPVIDPAVSASAAVRGATDPDPLAAALRAIEAASWSMPDEAAFSDDVRDRTR